MNYKAFVLLSCIGLINIMKSQSLDGLAHKYQTDKKSGFEGHNYVEYYNIYFSPLRHSPIKFLEIGFASGGSARMWEHYFPKAQLYFIDIKKELSHFATNLSARSRLHIADQGNEKELLNFIKTAGENFDIIIDDGGHTMQQQIISFKTLFPYLKKGGIYVIEDLHTSYWNNFGSETQGSLKNPISGPHSTTEFLKKIIDDVNYISSYTGYANREENWKKMPHQIFEQLSLYQKQIKSIHFYPSICFILKY